MVGCGDSIAPLRTGMLLTVDGSSGNVGRVERQV
jgi:hypothetical protein